MKLISISLLKEFVPFKNGITASDPIAQKRLVKNLGCRRPDLKVPPLVEPS